MSGKTDFYDLQLMVQSQSPIICIETHEERRVMATLAKVAQSLNKPMMCWDIVDGLRRFDCFD